MIVVSGCPRSGTSLMMLLHKEALGEDRIIGTQWMGIDIDIADPKVSDCINYIKDKQNPSWREEQEETKQMNPNGFWECRWTVRGIQWVQNPPKGNKVCKIVSQGLADSNPAYIDKVIMMVRHPWSVANSHKDLKTQIPLKQNRNKDIGNGNPQMYISVTASVCKWIIANKPNVHLVDFDELISNPDPAIDSLSEFIGDGDWRHAKKVIKPKLNRNNPERLDDSDTWDLSLAMHEEFKLGNWQKVVEIHESYIEKQEKKERVNFFCPRWGGNVENDFCTNCKSGDEKFVERLKTASIKRRIDWGNEPCLWECGMNPDRKSYTPLTIEQSIKNNHWCEDTTNPAELTISAQAKNATKAITKGITSVVKTQVLRKDRVSDKVYQDRLNTCANCPGNHAVYKNGALFTCGQFKNSITGQLPTCGCVLTKKARDEKEDCPMGYWTKLTIEGK